MQLCKTAVVWIKSRAAITASRMGLRVAVDAAELAYKKSEESASVLMISEHSETKNDSRRRNKRR